jgi:predicted nucleic acid-binding protein
MRHSPFTAVYDACVLYPAPLRDLLIRLAGKGLYRAKWTAEIDDEWKRNLLANRPDLRADQLDRVSELMVRAVPDALVTGHHSLYVGLILPDPDDIHVLAAAIRCNAEVIVTFNLKDFPLRALSEFEIEAQHPDEFIMNLWDLDRAAVLSAASEMRRALVRDPYTTDKFLECIYRQGLPQVAGAMRDYAPLL